MTAETTTSADDPSDNIQYTAGNDTAPTCFKGSYTTNRHKDQEEWLVKNAGHGLFMAGR